MGSPCSWASRERLIQEKQCEKDRHRLCIHVYLCNRNPSCSSLALESFQGIQLFSYILMHAPIEDYSSALALSFPHCIMLMNNWCNNCSPHLTLSLHVLTLIWAFSSQLYTSRFISPAHYMTVHSPTLKFIGITMVPAGRWWSPHRIHIDFLSFGFQKIFMENRFTSFHIVTDVSNLLFSYRVWWSAYAFHLYLHYCRLKV